MPPASSGVAARALELNTPVLPVKFSGRPLSIRPPAPATKLGRLSPDGTPKRLVGQVGQVMVAGRPD